MLTNLGGKLQKLLQLKYGPKRNERWGETHNTSNISSFWKVVLKTNDIFYSSISFNLGRKIRVSFWNDRWCMEVPLRVFFSKVYEQATNKNISIGHLWHRSRWDLGIRVHTDATAQAHATELKSLIQKCSLGYNECDEVFWKWKKYWIFTVRSACKHCIDDGHRLSQVYHNGRLNALSK